MKIGNPFGDEVFFPELTPLIDMMFMLLVFFMLTTSFRTEVRPKTIPVELPRSLHSTVITPEQAVIIGVGSDGSFTLDGRPCSSAALSDAVRIRTAADTTVVISGHGDAPYHSIVYIYDMLQSLGITRFVHDVK